MGGATERAVGRARPVARPGRGVPLQDAARGAHLATHPAETPLAVDHPLPLSYCGVVSWRLQQDLIGLRVTLYCVLLPVFN